MDINLTLKFLKYLAHMSSPLAVKNVAEKKKPNGIIALGAIVRGATPHFDYIASETSAGLTKVSLESKYSSGFWRAYLRHNGASHRKIR